MDTIRVNIAYRPLRICWAIKQGDFAAFREAVRNNHALWGGRFNPIVVVDRASEARAIVEAFRADIVQPLGASEEVTAFAASYKHLISPFFPKGGVFMGRGPDARANVLDVRNAMVSARDTLEWKQLRESKPRIYKWEAEDPLTDVFLMQLGAYPDKDICHTDYESMFKESLEANEVAIKRDIALPADLFDHPSIAYVSRYRARRHYSVQSYWDHPGFYLGDASDLNDLVAFWNLRAADIALLFVDRNRAARYELAISTWKTYTAKLLSNRRDHDGPKYAIWWHRKHKGDAGDITELQGPFGNGPATICGVSESLWNGLNLRPPMMYLGEATALGVLVTEGGKPKISFGLNDRPYATDSWFFTQHLVVSVDFLGGLYGRKDFTLHPPYVPELNEFYARAMHFHAQLRIESERIGLIVDAADSDSFVYALPTAELFKQVFALAGFAAKVSSGGLIARQLLAQLGGLQGGRVFKIPGARRLLKTHGPTVSFAKRAALQLIGGKDEDYPDDRFADHKDLYLEPREPGESLEPAHVFAYLVGKRLFRIGFDLSCPHCQLPSWFPVDDLRQRVNCQMCGESFDATDQLIGSEWAYRRSGVLGAERNAQGAVPVVLTLQQLDTNLSGARQDGVYSVSLDLIPTREQLPTSCEVDFAWLIPRRYPERAIVIIGECKDRGQSPAQGGDGGTINANDIANLRAVADSFPRERFEVYILLAKLCAFTPAEIELARSLNGKHQLRVILLTERELEPYHIFDRTKRFFKVDEYSSSPEDLARATMKVFLDPQAVAPEASPAASGR